MRKPSFLLVRHAGAKVLKVKWKMRLFLFDPEVKGTVATYIHCIQIAVCQQASKRSFDFLLNKFVKITCVKFTYFLPPPPSSLAYSRSHVVCNS